MPDKPDPETRSMPDPTRNNKDGLKESSPAYGSAWLDAAVSGIDVSLIEDSLSKTPWERMLANDDALNFAETLRTAMETRNAKP
jgi:hypothetical protein